MDYLENNKEEKRPLLKRIASLRMLLFVAAYAVYFIVSKVQLKAGDFLLQDSGELDSVTSYDYILPIINSVATVIILGAFMLAGFFAYNKSKVRMLRFPMAYCFSTVVGSFLTTLFTVVYATPLFDFSDVTVNITQIFAVAVIIIKALAALLFFIYFDGEKDDDSYYYDDDDYDDNPSSKSFRRKVLSHKLSVFFVVLIVSVGTEITVGIIRSLFTSAIMLVPDDFIWISNYIEIITEILTYVLYGFLSWYFSRKVRTTVKFVGLIFLVSYAMNAFSFVINSITNAFSQAGEHLLNSIFSMVFVSVAAFVISMIKLVVLVVLCLKLKKSRERRS